MLGTPCGSAKINKLFRSKQCHRNSTQKYYRNEANEEKKKKIQGRNINKILNGMRR
jgi:hypothetical protein